MARATFVAEGDPCLFGSGYERIDGVVSSLGAAMIDSATASPRDLLPNFTLVTGNRSKLEEASRILGFEPPSVDVDLPELQSLDLIEVLRAKADAAELEVDGPFVVEETGLELDALNGFPGPLVKWLLQAVGPEGVAAMGAALANPTAHARCAVLFRSGETEVIVEGVCSGRLILPPRGDTGFGWDPVFVPDGGEATCAELGDEVKDRIGHRGLAWRALIEKFGELEGG